jgi:hypothetical protein
MAYLIPAPTAQNFDTVIDYSTFAGVNGFQLVAASGTRMILLPGFARAATSGFGIFFPGINPTAEGFINLDATLVGPGGCYPTNLANTAMANRTVFGVYVIAQSSGTTGAAQSPLVSAVIATGNNFLPPGYDVYRRVGLCYVDNITKEIIPMIQSGSSVDRSYTLQDGIPAISAGTDTTFTTLNLSTGDGVVPPILGTKVALEVILNAGAPGESVSIQPTGLSAVITAPLTLTAPASGIISWSASIGAGALGTGSITGAGIEYKISSNLSTATINVAGFNDSLNAELF